MKMGNKILSFLEFSSISESEMVVDIDQILSPEKKAEMLDQLQKMGITKDTPGEFKFVDDEGNEYMLSINPDGELILVEAMIEGFRKNLLAGIVCTMLAGGMISCQKEELYDLSKDSRFTLKPEVLNTLGKEYFDSPVQGKDKIYVIAGNQSGAGKGRERYLYHDYTSKIKNYGSKPFSAQEYPDSFATGANGIAPVEVINVVPFTSEIANKLEYYNKTGMPLDKLMNMYKNVVVVKVHEASYYDWSDVYNPREIKDPTYKTGYAIYLTNLSAVKPGEIYPTMMEVMFNIYNTPPNVIPYNSEIMSLNNYYSSKFSKLLKEEPKI